MLSIYAEKLLARLIGYGSAFITLLVISNSVTDPVNAPKLAALGGISLGAFGVVITNWRNLELRSKSSTILLSVLFLVFALNALLWSKSPISQNFFGVYGRNNGFVTYILLVCLLLSTSTFSRTSSFNHILKGLVLAGIVNIAYCGWVIAFGDFVGWNNPYGNILGTLGNPNFIGAFLGIFISAYVAHAIASETSKIWKWSLLLVIPVTLYEIVNSHAIQGRVVALGGLALVGLSYLRFKANKVILAGYSIGITAVGLLAVFGALQIGPLTQYIYKTSVSLRGQYWLAGWNGGISNPFHGLGMDSLGDWYRRVRDPQAVILPGVNTVVNASHNVFIDMFAFGGWPLFLSYIAIVLFTTYSLIKTFLRLKKYDGIFTALSIAWIGYQVQSLISINQIGLAIWGWLLGGALISYERLTRPTSISSDPVEKSSQIKKSKKHSALKNSDPKTLVVSTGFAIIGLLIALPPFVSDSKWKSALNGQSVVAVEETMKPSFFNPMNVNKYVTNIQLLEKNNFQDLAHKYTLEALKWNSQSYDLWRFLYFINKSTPEEKKLALSKMRELDPLNPDVTSVK